MPLKRGLMLLTVSLETVPLETTQGHRGKYQCWSGGRKEQEEGTSYRVYWDFHRKGKASQSKQFRIRSF